MTEAAVRTCSWCSKAQPVNEFYFVSKTIGTRRGVCKRCIPVVKALQRDPSWRPTCGGCGEPAERSGPGRRLCSACLTARYAVEEGPRANGAHRLRLAPCSLCGGEKERGARAKLCADCRPWESYAKSLRRFGMVPADYIALLEAQGGGCAVCGTKPATQRLSIDHDHAMGECREAVRGLLCNECNYNRLPVFKERVDLLLRAADFLADPPAQRLLAERMSVSGAP